MALATVPVTLAPVIELNPEPLPLMLAPVILPDALITPVTYSPSGAKTTTFDVPFTPTVMFALAPTLTLELPFVMAAPAVAIMPVSCEPSPMKNPPVSA